MSGGRQIVHKLVRAGALAGVLIAASGCSSSSGDAVNNGLSAMDPGPMDPIDLPVGDQFAPDSDQDDVAQMVANSMLAYDDLFASTDGPGSAEIPEASPPEIGSEGVADVAIETDPDPVEPGEPELTPEDRARALATQLETALRESADDPYQLAIRLAGLLAGEPDAAARLESLLDRLPEDQRSVARAVAAIISEAGSDPASLTDLLVAQADRLDEARPVRIGTLAMCSRVEGYGRYSELPSMGFVAGSPMRMIVYTEVEHFQRTEIAKTASQPVGYGSVRTAIEDGWEVRLSQELQLYHESDGLLAWRRPEEVTVYRARSKPRDFFVVDQIELPRTLTVGAYRLKVVLRDLADRSVDERLVPIRVVADPALAAAPTSFGR